MQVNPGELNKRITILKESDSENENGFKNTEPVVVVKRWAKYSRDKGKEKDGDIENHTTWVRFLIRYTQGLDTNMTVRYAGKDYNIRDINDYGDKHEYMSLTCEMGE